MRDETMKHTARFGNHADSLTDYHVEVHLIRGIVTDFIKHGIGDREQIAERIDKAWLDVVQPEWIDIKNFLREIDAEFRTFNSANMECSHEG